MHQGHAWHLYELLTVARARTRDTLDLALIICTVSCAASRGVFPFGLCHRTLKHGSCSQTLFPTIHWSQQLRHRPVSALHSHAAWTAEAQALLLSQRQWPALLPPCFFSAGKEGQGLESDPMQLVRTTSQASLLVASQHRQPELPSESTVGGE